MLGITKMDSFGDLEDKYVINFVPSYRKCCLFCDLMMLLLFYSMLLFYALALLEASLFLGKLLHEVSTECGLGAYLAHALLL